MRKRLTVALLVTSAISVLAGGRADVRAQQGRAGGAEAPASARSAAPIDLTGYWVSIVTEDWRYRMVTPARGDYASVPLNQAAKKIADVWDPARDEAAGEQCKSYGAARIMQVPTRLHITWQDDNTLKVDTDAGMQTRLFRFGGGLAPAGLKPTWQGDSRGAWELPVPGRGGGAGVPAAGRGPAPRFGNLKVVTTNLRPGHLRKNGIPYSAQTQMTEYWNLVKQPNGEEWLIITSVVRDPVYLQIDWITNVNFLREPDGSKWDPQPCSARW